MNEKWFLLSIPEIEKKLKTNAASGLSRKAARSACRANAHKTEKLFIYPKKSVAVMLKEMLADFVLIMLLICALMAVLFDEFHLGMTTLVLCIAGVALSLIFYYRSQRSMEQMDAYFLPTAKVIRGGKLYRVSFENVVPGDVILLEKGDIVCSDARLVLSNGLKVSMRISKNEYVRLKKQSNGVVNASEMDPRNHANTVHAGSIIESGSARAIVYATGGYTYLGAMTGGIRESYNDSVPAELKRLRALCSKVSMISMLCVLPFCIMSLLFSHMRGGTATLSASFLTALAICASSMTQLACTLCKVFFVIRIKLLASNPRDPVALRTTAAFDRMRDVTHLFMLDGCAVTDGILHFDTAFTADGEIINFDNLKPSARYLLELAAIYNTAESESLSVGISVPDRFKKGLDELVTLSKVDTGALKIRCPIRSYAQGVTTDSADKVFFQDTGREAVLSVSFDVDVVSQCKTVLLNNGIQALNAVSIDRIKHTLHFHNVRGKRLLIFTLATPEKDLSDADRCFVGAVVLREGVDASAHKAIANLRAKGVKVISFVGTGSQDAPEIPVELHVGVKAHKEDFLKNSFPLTYKFGEIDTYYGFEPDDISMLIDYSHKNNATVGVIAFSDHAIGAIKSSDLFITCAPIINVFSAKDEKELYALESVGRGTSVSCEQRIKKLADVLITRPEGKTGGIKALNAVFNAANAAVKGLEIFLKYLFTVQIIRILTVAVPMVFGASMLDARHVLLYSMIFDIPVLMMLATIRTRKFSQKTAGVLSIKELIANNKQLLLMAAGLSVATVLLPIIMDFIGIIGPHLYVAEYMFCAVLWLHMTVIYVVCFDGAYDISTIIKNKKYLAYFVGIVLLMLLISLISPLGLLFEWIHLPIAYFLLGLIPAAAFVLIAYLGAKKKK